MTVMAVDELAQARRSRQIIAELQRENAELREALVMGPHWGLGVAMLWVAFMLGAIVGVVVGAVVL